MCCKKGGILESKIVYERQTELPVLVLFCKSEQTRDFHVLWGWKRARVDGLNCVLKLKGQERDHVTGRPVWVLELSVQFLYSPSLGALALYVHIFCCKC